MLLRYRSLLTLLPLLAVLAPNLAHAWWNDAWSFRKKVTLNTSATGVEIKQGVADVPVLIRLHTGNFSFLDANEDGGDLRVVGPDEKTPLKLQIEQWDPTNELALVWVHVPSVTAESATNHVWLYSGNKDARREDGKDAFDTATALVLHFADQGTPLDSSPYAHQVAESTVALDPKGMIGQAATFDGSARIRIAAAPTLKSGAQGGLTFSAWLKLAGPQAQAQLASMGAFQLGLDGLKVVGQAGGAKVSAGADLTPGQWHHVAAVSDGSKLTLYVDGAPVGEGAAVAAPVAGDLVIGERFAGSMDEVQLSSAARSADWIRASWAAQGDSKLVTYGEDEQSSGGGGHSYFTILISAVTLDGWVVIGILAVMFVISAAVMVGKGMFVARTDRANQAFIEQFQKNPVQMLDPAMVDKNPGPLQRSSLYRIYRIGLRELKQRFDHYDQSGQAKQLSPQALGAIKASMDAGMVRETTRLNSQMVLLTIAISGGPFLGLLGTVVGVMITFAAIAAVGDVNVNSIAPGIAAALVATVAGLGVAIPALFGYNYLASRIKTISNDMTVFADELVTKMAERYAP